ncbi:MAG: hypothetical protein WBQ17_03535 [Rhizomicrobium sp.]|jgi:hypothetical protein
MRITSAVLAILVAIGCAIVAFFVNWREGPGIEAAGLAVALFGSAVIALVAHRLRYLAASWGLFIGIWVIVIEFLVLQPMRSKGIVVQDKALTLTAVAAVTALALIGLVLALIAPAQD